MTGIHLTRCTRQLTSFQVPYWRHCTALQWLEKGNALFLSLVIWPAIVLIPILCIVSPGQAQTPETTFRIGIYGPNFNGDPMQGSICGRLNNTSSSAFLPGTPESHRSLQRLGREPKSSPSEAGSLRRSLLTGEEGC